MLGAMWQAVNMHAFLLNAASASRLEMLTRQSSAALTTGVVRTNLLA